MAMEHVRGDVRPEFAKRVREGVADYGVTEPCGDTSHRAILTGVVTHRDALCDAAAQQFGNIEGAAPLIVGSDDKPMRRLKPIRTFITSSPLALRVAAILLVCAIFAPRARCQGAPAGPLAPQPGVTPEKRPTPDEQKRAIRVRTAEVTAPVTVRNRAGEMIFDLTKKDFHIYDNGVEQTIDHFDLGGDPLSVVLAVETSSHIEALLPAVRQTGIVFSQTVMAKTAEAAVLGFDDTVNMLEKFTTDPDSVQRTINHLPMGPSGVRLYDAMSRGVSLLEERPAGRRRILVVVSEAQDNGSESKLGEVLRAAQLANVTIYSIGLSTTSAELRAKPSESGPAPIGPPGTFPIPTPGGVSQVPSIEQQMQQQGGADLLALAVWLVRTGRNALGPNSLAVASKATGGLHESPKKDRSIEKAMDAIGGELHAQYTLGYRPPGEEPTGYHEIKVTVDRPGVNVRTRPGYYIAPPEL
jgi:VWFA-related protein